MTRKQLILKAALDAGRAIASIKPSHQTRINKEGRGNYVTLADKTSESIIFTLIRENCPQDVVLSEETASNLTEQELLEAECLWIIDPIDGTANYQYLRKYSCVSIGYAEKGKLIHGVVYDPFREELYTAERGQGAYHNDEKMTVSKTDDINHSIIITDNAYDPAIVRKHLETILTIPNTPWVLMKGSAALEMCEVAAGQADIFFSYCLQPWDNAASFLILEEAGAVTANRTGKSVNFLSSVVIAGNPKIVNEFVKVTNH